VRILQIHPFLRGDRIDPRAGGKSRAALLLTEYLLDQGHEVALFPFPERLWLQPVMFGLRSGNRLPVLPTMARPGVRNFVGAARAARQMRQDRTFQVSLFYLEGLRRALADFAPEIIHSHQRLPLLPLLLRETRRRTPLVFTHHTGEPGPMLTTYDHVVFVSRGLQSRVCAATGLDRAKTSVIYYPIDSAFIQAPLVPAAARRGFVFAGGLTEAKGVDLLLEAWRRNTDLNAHPLHVCGAGEREADLRDFASRHDLNVVFEGRLTVSALQHVLAHSRALINPSRLEGFSIALLEALACGTPVIGWAEQVRELEQWWRLPVGLPFDGRSQTADELAEAVRNLLEGPTQRDASRADIAAHARRHFTLERYGEENLEVYRRLQASRARG
jgi:glycosyltransferase involved in cell wall biosynthesis